MNPPRVWWPLVGATLVSLLLAGACCHRLKPVVRPVPLPSGTTMLPAPTAAKAKPPAPKMRPAPVPAPVVVPPQPPREEMRATAPPDKHKAPMKGERTGGSRADYDPSYVSSEAPRVHLNVGTAPPPPTLTVDDLLARLAFGHLAFNTPPVMRWRDRAPVQLVLGVQSTLEELVEQIVAQGQVQTGTLRVSDRMAATLTGVGVDIVRVTPEVQAISHREPTTWLWEVIAREPGTHPLHLTVTALLSIEGQATERPVKVFDRMIRVRVTVGQRVRQAAISYWQWMVTAVLVPVISWWWHRRRKKRRGKH